MAFMRRSRKVGIKTVKTDKEFVVPEHFQCPISLELMKDPVTASTGITYDRQSIEKWLEMGNSTCPVTHLGLMGQDALIPNHSLRRMIQEWCVANQSHGVERIPTPKTPLSSDQVLDLLSGIHTLCRDQQHVLQCSHLVRKAKALARESERNRKCFVSSCASRRLAASFEAVSILGSATYDELLNDILSAIPIMFPLDEKASNHLGSPHSLTSIASILKYGDLAGRLSAALVLKELLAHSKHHEKFISETEGLVEALVKLIKEPISPHATRASLLATFYIINAEEKLKPRLIDAGLIPVLLDLLVEPEKSTAEKALAVLDGLLNVKDAQAQAKDHALTMPILVKKMFRVSETATQFAVSALWKLCMSCKDGGDGECTMEALRVGAFQKLLLLLQIGCSEATKEKATELLKMLNVVRERSDCIETVDFKGVNRPF